MSSVSVIVELYPTRPVSGTLRSDGLAERRFTGWTALFSALQETAALADGPLCAEEGQQP